MPGYFVYIVECRDGSYYTGITTDVARRIAQHNAGTGAKYTRGRGPVRLLCCTPVEGRAQAQVLEARVKRARKDQKVPIILAAGAPHDDRADPQVPEDATHPGIPTPEGG